MQLFDQSPHLNSQFFRVLLQRFHLPVGFRAQLYLVIFIFIVTGCAKPTIISTPAKRPVGGVSKRVPPSAEIPPTQRPYKINGRTYYPLPTSHGYVERGIASWYGKKFHGRKTSNGETYNMYAKTAAHKTLPMGTMLLVKNIANNKEIVVRVNDRGPFVKGRIIDLSLTGAREIDMVTEGTFRKGRILYSDRFFWRPNQCGETERKDVGHG